MPTTRLAACGVAMPQAAAFARILQPGPRRAEEVAMHKLLAANRSEIAIRVFRTAHELGIRTVAVYSHEDRFALHRFKADEPYLVGRPGEPIRAYLDIPARIALAH